MQDKKQCSEYWREFGLFQRPYMFLFWIFLSPSTNIDIFVVFVEYEINIYGVIVGRDHLVAHLTGCQIEK